MEKHSTELINLLSYNDRLKRVPSTRFQVSKTEPTINQQEHVLEEETNGKPSLIKNSGQKTSSTGRFMVCTENDTINPLEPALRDTNHPTNGWDNTSHDSASLIRSKGVHFSVGDKDEMKREHTDNTTFNMKSWRNIRTIEHPPIIDFYRNSVDIAECSAARPSMIQLIHGEMAIPEEMGIEDFKLHNDELVESHVQGESKALRVGMFPTPQQQTRIKFGWVQGVFIRCLLNIFGVMLYLRISWVAGQAGIGLGSLIVILAAIVTTITAISTCAICTNGDVKGGGAYFLISRSLGPEFGGSIGLIFSVANAVGAAMYIVGFAETVRDILKENDFMIIDGGIWDVRIIGFAACIILMGIVFIGTEFESKMQMGLLAILLTSILNYIVGSVFPPNEEMIKRGSTGYSLVTLTENFFPAFRDGENFFSVFSIYFPAATGIMAGANISGDLADPQRAIPIGTLLAIFVTTLVYLATVWMTGSTCVRDADGLNFPLWNGSTLISPQCAVNSTCPYGLMNYFQVMEMESFWGPLITAGIFAATLSSALASLVSAPKVFQAVCKDRLFPKINYFSKPYGKNEEPRRAYALAFIIAVAMIAIGDLNDIAPIISNFFLASYALINYACFDQSFADSPGFRPGFKYYNLWISLIGALLCIIVMFIISWVTALITFFCFAALFLYISHRKPDVNWGSSTQAHSYKNALAGMIKLSNTEEHVKNYRPQFLVLCGNPAARPSLVDFAYSITKGSSLMICGYVVQYNPSDRVYSVIRKLDRQINEWLRKRHIKSFYSSVANSSIRAGAQSLIQVSGLGKLRPNIILIGFKSNWDGEGPTRNKLTELNDYFGTIQDAFDNNMGLCVLRNGDVGLDFSDAMKLLNLEETNRLLPDVKENMVAKDFSSSEISVRKESFTPSLQQKSDEDRESEKGELGFLPHKDSARSMERFAKLNHHYIAATTSLTENFSFDDVEDAILEGSDKNNACGPNGNDIEMGNRSQLNDDVKRDHHTFSVKRRNSRRPTVEQKALLASISRFHKKIKKGVIDVWWLYDDGGLTLLIPHLLTIPKSYLEGAKLRVFTISTSSHTMEHEQRGMAALLSKFRINFSDVLVIADIGRKPRSDTLAKWEKLITPFIASDMNYMAGMTTRSELASQKEKTFRQLRTAELLEEHSMQADLIVMTLPVPRKGLVSPALYLSWLDMMTRGLPPTLLIRGNQSSVLTFYS